MHTVITDIARPDVALVERAKGVYVCMAGIEAGPRQCVDPAIKPLRLDWKIAGPAFTVRPENWDDTLATRAALKYLKPGDVLVIDAAGHTESSAFGASMAGGAVENGCAGVVVDGAVLTGQMLREEEGLPVFCRGTVARNHTSAKAGSINVPVICGGVIVNPGDLVLGDEDGVVVLPRERAADLVARAEAAGKKSEAGRASGDSFHARARADEKLRALPGVDWQD